MLEVWIVDLVDRQFVQRPCGREGSENETVERRINVRRHRLLDDFDAAPRIIGQMFGDEWFAECFDSGFVDYSFAWIAFELFDGRQLRLWPSLTQNDPPSQNLRNLTLILGAGLLGKSSRLLKAPYLLIGQPSSATSHRAWPPRSILCSSTLWQSAHDEANGPRQKRSGSPLCGSTWWQTVAPVMMPRDRQRSHSGCLANWSLRILRHRVVP